MKAALAHCRLKRRLPFDRRTTLTIQANRMKQLLLIPALMIVSACDRGATPLMAYRHPSDALAKAVPVLELFGVYPCASAERVGGSTSIVGIPTEECVKMLPSHRYRGIWLDEFEGSRFFEGVSRPQDVKAIIRRRKPGESFGEWLSLARPMDDKIPTKNSPKSRMVALDFIGRRTAYPGRYGHFGMSKDYIVVDQLLSAREVYRSTTNYLSYEPDMEEASAR